MKVLEKGTMPDGTAIQIEEWNETYSFMPFGNVLASYPKSKVSHEGGFAPKGNETYRFSFDFKSNDEAKKAFEELELGTKVLADYKELISIPKYADCI
jgi:hypothetical protein